MTCDPVTLEILSTRFVSSTEEMGLLLKRTARTLYVKEANDFGVALAGPNGRFFAYPNGIGVCSFVDLDCSTIISAVTDLAPGDVIIANHPYRTDGSPTHTPDITLVAPYFHEGNIVAYGWTFVHSSDVGGRVPSSISPSSTELFQEGLLIPPMRLVRKGGYVEEVVSLLEANTRTPDDIFGDLKAMLAALDVGRKRIAEMVDKFGLATVLSAQKEIVAYAKTKAHAVLKRIPDGTYWFSDYLDDDGVSPCPIRLCITMVVKNGKVFLDFTGTDPQTGSPYNIPTGGKRHPWLTLRLLAFIYTFDKTIPLNTGIFENITVGLPSGCIVNPQFPAPVGIRHLTAQRVYETLNGALARAMPKAMPACNGGVIIPIVLSEPTSADGSNKVLIVEPLVGGMGARFGADGVDGRDCSIANLGNNPLEVLEADAAVRVLRFGLRSDSGGPGKWRGGVGIEFEFEILKDGCSVLARGMDRFHFSPWGIEGGMPSVWAQTIVNRGKSDERHIGKIDVIYLNKGDTLTVLTPGGGGYGNPFERAFEDVQKDIQSGLVSSEQAKNAYGVVVMDDGKVNEQQSRLLRASRQSDGVLKQASGFDSVHIAWERFFDEGVDDAFSMLYSNVAISQRSVVKRQIISDVLNPGKKSDWTSSDITLVDAQSTKASVLQKIAEFTDP
ncbi:MAG: hydantoinase B/oxoprolinase family protein [Methyloligellaceae bacterium]